MGHSAWSADMYATKSDARLQSGVAGVTSTYTKKLDQVAPSQRKTHKDLDPYGIKFRESRDSNEHPASVPVVVVFDETGSMNQIPPILQKKLGGLMHIIEKKGYLEHPQIMFGAVGDARQNEVSPVQFSQFESGIEMDDHLDNIYLEGGGGGNRHESYDLAMYFVANHTVTDAWEKRSKKGYFFMIGDEQYYKTVSRNDIERVLGYKPEADIPIEQVVEQLKEKWEVFFILPSSSQYGTTFRKQWTDLFGENVLVLDDPNAVAETIALAIGTAEGIVDLDQGANDLDSIGSDKKAILSATTALSKYSAGRNITKAGSVTGTLPQSTDSSGVTKL